MVSFCFEHLVPPIHHVLCLGAHCDDLEIGCGGTILKLATGRIPPAFTWVVFSSDATREAEALQSARMMLPKSSSSRIIIKKFRDGFWGCMDTFKDKQLLEDLYTRGHVPWEVWKTSGLTVNSCPSPNISSPDVELLRLRK